MNTLSATTSLAQSLASALLYSLWQGLLVYGMLYVCLRALPGISARARYYLSYLALLIIIICFAGTWMIQYNRLDSVIATTHAYTVSLAASGTAPVVEVSAPVAPAAWYAQLLNFIEQNFTLVLAIYAIGLGFMLSRFFYNATQARALRTTGLAPVSEKYLAMLIRCRQKLGIYRHVGLYLSTRISVPVMVGAIKPFILLPIATINHLSADQVETILLHELAHIRRHDYLLNMCQVVIETILFFNPFVWLTSAIIRKEREHCCDDLVVAAADPLSYAHALSILESHRTESSLALAASGTKHQLFNRIKRIMEMKKNNTNYSQLAVIVIAFIALSCTIAAFTATPSFAQKAKDKKADTVTKSSYKYKAIIIDDKGNKKVIEKNSLEPIEEHIKDEDGNDLDIKLSVNGDDAQNGTKVQKKIILDSGGKQKTIMIVTNDHKTTKGNKDCQTTTTSINLEEIEKEIAGANEKLKDVDWKQINAEIEKSLAEVNKEKGMTNKQISIEIKKEMDEAMKELENSKEELAKAGNVKVKVITKTDADARKVYDGYGEFLNKLNSDGLIDKSKEYSVRKEGDELYINDKKQTNSVYDKYRDYLKDKKFSISGNKGYMSVLVND